MKNKPTSALILLCTLSLLTPTAVSAVESSASTPSRRAAGSELPVPPLPGIGLQAIFSPEPNHGPGSGTLLPGLHADSTLMKPAPAPTSTLTVGSVRFIAFHFKQEFRHDLLLGLSTFDTLIAAAGREQNFPSLALPLEEQNQLRTEINTLIYRKFGLLFRPETGVTILDLASDIHEAKEAILSRIFNHLCHRTANRDLRQFMRSNFELGPGEVPFRPQAGREELLAGLWENHFAFHRANQPKIPPLSATEWEGLASALRKTLLRHGTGVKLIATALDPHTSLDPGQELQHGMERVLTSLYRRSPKLPAGEQGYRETIEKLQALPYHSSARRTLLRKELLETPVAMLTALVAPSLQEWGDNLQTATHEALAKFQGLTPETPATGSQASATIDLEENERATKRPRIQPGSSLRTPGTRTLTTGNEEENSDSGTSDSDASNGDEQNEAKLRVKVGDVFRRNSFLGGKLTALAQKTPVIQAGQEKEGIKEWIEQHTLLEIRDTADALSGALQDFSKAKTGTGFLMPANLQRAIFAQTDAAYREAREAIGSPESVEDFASHMVELKEKLFKNLYQRLYESGHAPLLTTYFQSYQEAGNRPFLAKQEHQADFQRVWEEHLQRVTARGSGPILDVDSSERARAYYQQHRKNQANIALENPESLQRTRQGRARWTDVMFHLAPEPGEDADYVQEGRQQNRRWNLTPFHTQESQQQQQNVLLRVSLVPSDPDNDRAPITSESLLRSQARAGSGSTPALSPNPGRSALSAHGGVDVSQQPRSSVQPSQSDAETSQTVSGRNSRPPSTSSSAARRAPR